MLDCLDVLRTTAVDVDESAGHLVRRRDHEVCESASREPVHFEKQAPLVQRHLTQDDWTRLDDEVFSKDYTPREIPAFIGWVSSGCPTEALGRMPGANAAARASCE